MSTRLRRIFRSTPSVLGTIASVIAIAGVGIAAYGALQPSQSQATLPERRQIVAFHQVANRICSENTQAMNRAFPAAHSHSVLLAYLARATKWGIEDLSGVIPPSSAATDYVGEIEDRRHIADELLELQRAAENGDKARRARVQAKLVIGEARAIELNRSMKLVRCAPILPPHFFKLEISHP
jgi:hypothetical protein